MNDLQKQMLEERARELGQSNRIVWTPELEEAVCDLYREGFSLQKIGQLDGMPSRRSILVRREQYPDFEAKLKKARESTAYLHYDDYLDLMDRLQTENIHEDDVAALRLLREMKKDALKWNDRETYGDHTKLTGSIDQIHTFVIDTGIRDEAIPVDSQVVPQIAEGGS